MSSRKLKGRRASSRSEADWISRMTANGQRLLPGFEAYVRSGRHRYPTRSRPSDCAEAKKQRSVYLQ